MLESLSQTRGGCDGRAGGRKGDRGTKSCGDGVSDENFTIMLCCFVGDGHETLISCQHPDAT